MTAPSINAVEFKLVPSKPGMPNSSLGMVFDVLIDGLSYWQTLSKFESTQPQAWVRACIPGLGTAEVMHSLDKHGARVHPYVCCISDNWDDWDYNCLIEIYGQEVVCWRDWQYYDMTTSKDSLSNYRELDPLVFDYQQYMDAVKRARQLVEEEGTTLHMENRFWWQHDR